MKILVPTDGSERSTKAIEMAVKLAEKEGAQITLVGVAPYAPADFETLPVEDLQTRFDAVVKQNLDKAKAMFEQKGLKVEVRLENGINAGNAIIQLAEEGGYDHIIMGSTGATGLSRFFLGSTASKVVQHAPCTVTVVR